MRKSSDVKNKKVGVAQRNKKTKALAYRQVVKPELSKKLYGLIYQRIVVQRKYSDPDYSAKQLAEELGTNTRYLSAVINSNFGKNFSTLVNELRVNDAKQMFRSTSYNNLRIEDIGLKVGFSTRQCFYTAFNKYVGMTPRQYRMRCKPRLKVV